MRGVSGSEVKCNLDGNCISSSLKLPPNIIPENTNNDITYIPGTSTIHVSGTTVGHFYQYTYAAKTGTSAVTLTWSFDIAISSITNLTPTDAGVLNMAITSSTVNVVQENYASGNGYVQVGQA